MHSPEKSPLENNQIKSHVPSLQNLPGQKYIKFFGGIFVNR